MNAPDPRVRTLRFETMQELLADAEALDGGPVRAAGNWTPGQILQHLADAIDRSMDGFGGRAPDAIRERARARKDEVLESGITPGMQVVPELAHLMPAEGVSWPDGLASLRRAVARAETATLDADHPYLGPLDDGEWRRLHCRHAELHLGFLEKD